MDDGGGEKLRISRRADLSYSMLGLFPGCRSNSGCTLVVLVKETSACSCDSDTINRTDISNRCSDSSDHHLAHVQANVQANNALDAVSGLGFKGREGGM